MIRQPNKIVLVLTKGKPTNVATGGGADVIGIWPQGGGTAKFGA